MPQHKVCSANHNGSVEEDESASQEDNRNSQVWFRYVNKPGDFALVFSYGVNDSRLEHFARLEQLTAYQCHWLVRCPTLFIRLSCPTQLIQSAFKKAIVSLREFFRSCPLNPWPAFEYQNT